MLSRKGPPKNAKDANTAHKTSSSGRLMRENEKELLEIKPLTEHVLGLWDDQERWLSILATRSPRIPIFSKRSKYNTFNTFENRGQLWHHRWLDGDVKGGMVSRGIENTKQRTRLDMGQKTRRVFSWLLSRYSNARKLTKQPKWKYFVNCNWWFLKGQEASKSGWFTPSLTAHWQAWPNPDS